MSTVSDVITSLNASADRADISSRQMYGVANGPATGAGSTVTTDSGTVPSLAKWLADNQANINAQALIGARLLDNSVPGNNSGMVGYGGPQLTYAANTAGFKLKEVRSICDAPYNCRPDGNIATGAGTDWATQVQQAVNDAAAAGDRGVFIPPGFPFKIGSQIHVPSQFTLYGVGGVGNFCSTLFAPNSFNAAGLIICDGTGGPPTTISGLAVIAQNGGAGAASIGINSVANGVFIQNCWVSGFNQNVVLANSDNFLINSAVEEARAGGSGVNVTSTDVSVLGNIIYNCYVGISVANVPFLDGVVTLQGNRLVACGFDGILINNSSNVQLLGNSAGHNNLSRFSDAGISLVNSTNITITDFMARLGGGPSTVADAIKMVGCSSVNVTGGQFTGWRDGLSATNCSGLNVTGAYSQSNSRRGMYVAGGDRINLSGNNCINNGTAGATTDAGIYVVNSAGSSLFSVTGNICSQNGSGPQDYGIYAELTDNGTTTGYINIVGNTCMFNGTADIGTAGATQNINIESNIAITVPGNIPDIAPASTVIIPPFGNFFHVFGGSAINITTLTNPIKGRRVTLRFSSGGATLKDSAGGGTGNLELNGDFVVTANDTITLAGSGALWYEVSRSAN